MFLDVDKAEERLKSPNNLANAPWIKKDVPEVPKKGEAREVQIIEKPIHLPGKNRINLTNEERTEIAIESRTGKLAVEIAQERGISPMTVQAIKHGKTKGIDEEKVENVINEVKDRALNRLMTSLGLLTDDKLSGCSAKDLSVIASNMGRVVEKITPKEQAPDNINFIIYAPEQKQERAYDSVEV